MWPVSRWRETATSTASQRPVVQNGLRQRRCRTRQPVPGHSTRGVVGREDAVMKLRAAHPRHGQLRYHRFDV